MRLKLVNVAFEHNLDGSDGFLNALTNDEKKLRRLRKPAILKINLTNTDYKILPFTFSKYPVLEKTIFYFRTICIRIEIGWLNNEIEKLTMRITIRTSFFVTKRSTIYGSTVIEFSSWRTEEEMRHTYARQVCEKYYARISTIQLKQTGGNRPDTSFVSLHERMATFLPF